MAAQYSIDEDFIIIRFPAKPSDETRRKVKEAGFEYVTVNGEKVWRAEMTDERRSVAGAAVLAYNQSGKTIRPQVQEAHAEFNSGGGGLFKEFTITDIIPLEVTEQIRTKTIVNCVKKFHFTLMHSIKERTELELLYNLYMGDLAKNCIVYYLRSHCKNNPDIRDYDEERTDNFERADSGDFYINGYKVEVKSSTPPKHNDEMEENSQLIKYRDIKIIARKTRNERIIYPQQFDCFVFPQVYFRRVIPDGRDLTKEEHEGLSISPSYLTKIIDIDSFNNPLFFGWSTKPDVIFFCDRLKKPQWSYENALYWCCPLRYSRTLDELVAFADKTVKK